MLALAVGWSAALAQTTGEEPARLKPVPPLAVPAPFSPEAHAAVRAIEFRPAEAMTKPDRLIAANAESSIAEHAARGGIDFSGAGWSYEQVVCPALPNHLFLQYRRATGTGSETEFSASIPRGGEGRVRIIPIRRRGYSLFSPAPVNALTISAFNHIRAEEPEPQRSTGWLGNALCYAALAGARPQLPPVDAAPEPGQAVPAMSALLRVKDRNGEEIQFADASAAPHPMMWTMTFTQKGRLVKAAHGPAPMTGARAVPEETAPTLRPVPGETPAALQTVPKEAPATLSAVPPAR